jgi:XTP/dITP diphosphohydrolase
MELLIATSNPAKLAEIKQFLGDLPIKIVSLHDINIPADAPETGKTFSENAILKAKYYFAKSGMPTIADDGGFEIDALNGEPGVKSHRWVNQDHESTDEELIQFTMKRMIDVPLEKRGAQLHLFLAFILLNGQLYTSESLVRGIIPLKPSTKHVSGFPYRSLLFLPEINKFYDHAVMTPEETEKYNHRGNAVRALIPDIKKAFGIL